MRELRWPHFWLGLWLAAVGAVIVLSLLPPPAMAVQAPRNADKLLHFCAYFALAFAALQLFERRAILIACALGLIGLGLVLEWAQGALVPDIRSADPWDGLANSLGVLGAMALVRTPLASCLQELERRLRT